MADHRMLLGGLVTLGYVAVIYFGGLVGCPATWLDRHHPKTIRIRCISVLLYSLLSLLLLPRSSLVWWPIVWRPITRTIILLLPILAIEILSQRRQRRQYIGWRKVVSKLDIGMVRNIVVGPLAEEIIFRHTLHHLLHSKYRLKSSILFSLAHIHPLLYDRSKDAIMGSIFQAIFTFIFGWYVAGVYVGTDGSLITCILVHSICNIAGFPDLDWFDQASPMAIAAIILLSLSCIILVNII